MPRSVTDEKLVRDLLGIEQGVIERIVPGAVPEEWEREHAARYRWAVTHLRRTRARRVLDVACGVGYGSQLLEQAGYEVSSTDRFHPGLRFGVRNFRLLRPVVADAHDLPFKPGYFDAVVSFETVEHLARPHVFVKAVRRVLKLGGMLLLSTPNRELTHPNNPHHIHEFRLEELKRLVEREQFSISRIFGQYLAVPDSPWTKVIGFRRILWQLSRSSEVRGMSFPFQSARVWCVKAVRLG